MFLVGIFIIIAINLNEYKGTPIYLSKIKLIMRTIEDYLLFFWNLT